MQNTSQIWGMDFTHKTLEFLVLALKLGQFAA